MSMFDKRRSNETDNRPEPAGETPPSRRDSDLAILSSPRDVAVIGETIRIQGDVSGDENLVINGKVDGTVVLKAHDLTVGQSGLVTASVTAHVVRIEGEVTGDITGAEKVVVTRTGKVRGNITSPRVSLEDGARFKGSIDMDPGSGAQASAPKGPKAVGPAEPADQADGRASAPSSQPGSGSA